MDKFIKPDASFENCKRSIKDTAWPTAFELKIGDIIITKSTYKHSPGQTVWSQFLGFDKRGKQVCQGWDGGLSLENWMKENTKILYIYRPYNITPHNMRVLYTTFELLNPMEMYRFMPVYVGGYYVNKKELESMQAIVRDSCKERWKDF